MRCLFHAFFAQLRLLVPLKNADLRGGEHELLLHRVKQHRRDRIVVELFGESSDPLATSGIPQVPNSQVEVLADTGASEAKILYVLKMVFIMCLR